MLASVDGAIGPAGEARVPVTDDGLLRGDGAFDALRLYGGRPFALDEHLTRFERSCAGIRLECDHAALRREIAALLEAAGPVDGVLRFYATRGGRRIVLVLPLPQRPAVARLATIRYAPNRVTDGLKTFSYAANMLASRLAQEQGYDDALLVTPHGRVLEGTTSSFFWVRDGVLRTPPLEDRIFGSITRERLIAVAGAIEEPTTLDTLHGAEEAFLASSVREVQPVAVIDELRLAATPGPVTLHAHARLREAIEREL
ncbi:aminotransferase class IV [Solirubrobacter sp. CPCC 204708]|uniref:Aminotransferase class IV n=1 Tax=Solirubrobacter deserti TaxID=2282478 RepID=A0ABT4RC23_9ACTN|nr:aminotransferase class IV [Solirubrobacter deserti]MBE2317024.1 aminotransferase class IV [Solirubrobacter deserti]MDA0136084.1 aminotransferase class IV [Solirubrobacter deserti]